MEDARSDDRDIRKEISGCAGFVYMIYYIYLRDEKSLTGVSNLVHGLSMPFCIIFSHDMMYI